MSNTYEGVIGSHRFLMTSKDTIEVWDDRDKGEHPNSYIFVKDGAIKSEKDFQLEISYWCIDNNIIN